jgi:CRP-like cAMP-binding protein
MASEPSEVWGDIATSAFIESSHLFKSLDPEAHEDLLHLARRQTFEAGEPVIVKGQTPDDFFLIMDGVAEVTRQKDGRLEQVTHLDKGAFFGEFAVLTGGLRAVDVTARTGLTVIRFPVPLVASLSERYPKLKQLLTAMMKARQALLAK